MNKDIKMAREGAPQMSREAHSRQKEQPRQRLSGGSTLAVLKENPPKPSGLKQREGGWEWGGGMRPKRLGAQIM